MLARFLARPTSADTGGSGRLLRSLGVGHVASGGSAAPALSMVTGGARSRVSGGAGAPTFSKAYVRSLFAVHTLAPPTLLLAASQRPCAHLP